MINVFMPERLTGRLFRWYTYNGVDHLWFDREVICRRLLRPNGDPHIAKLHLVWQEAYALFLFVSIRNTVEGLLTSLSPSLRRIFGYRHTDFHEI
jgi:hypothetical protein